MILSSSPASVWPSADWRGYFARGTSADSLRRRRRCTPRSSERESSSLGDLAVAEGISPSTVTKIVNKLEADGLIDRMIDPADRRVHLVRLSAKGRRNIEAYRSKRNAWLAQQISKLDRTEMAGLESALSVFERLLVTEGIDPIQRLDL